MSEEDVVDLVRSTICGMEHLALAPEDVRDDAAIIADLGLDSLDYATVLIDCEAALGVHVLEDDIDWREIRTVRDLARLLARSRGSV